ncbi:DUF2161 family putative PD-(D/E)XK-type phosphodiesterase [Paenibacillus sp. ATY16]|uniref:DUF2161 domain-containing phosphodiesterase n=1 Tax=Paenibacillus sp. ATY16 TaxID=1759312 RepID=UPI00200D8648|nr:DUF2161 family putative PD-(D/E)XK-type phosphodiesterase [Paenibacillus sp. ATY16]MCK9862426.1 DUF2161 family putative PD-(D/E)XK-type phosphodiesterase [Paenibacillus sp. ATY16]
MAVNKEEELYSPIKAYYEKLGFTVKSEVLHCDLVAMKPDGSEAVVVEMKKTFNLALLLQGIERLRINDHVVLAVERNRKKSGAHNQRFSDITELCRMLGLGLMTVTFFKTKAPLIEMLCEPGEMPKRGIRRTRQARLLREFRERSGDYNVGGSTGRKLVTAYREKALRAAYAMQQAGILSPSQLASLTGNPQSASMLRSNYYSWFEKVGRGQYRLTPAGALALAEYAEVIAEWKETFTLPPAPEPKPAKAPRTKAPKAASEGKTSKRAKETPFSYER